MTFVKVRLINRAPLRLHAGESRHPEVFEIPGFRFAPAVASLPGMTPELATDFGTFTLAGRDRPLG